MGNIKIKSAVRSGRDQNMIDAFNPSIRPSNFHRLRIPWYQTVPTISLQRCRCHFFVCSTKSVCAVSSSGCIFGLANDPARNTEIITVHWLIESKVGRGRRSWRKDASITGPLERKKIKSPTKPQQMTTLQRTIHIIYALASGDFCFSSAILCFSSAILAALHVFQRISVSSTSLTSPRFLFRNSILSNLAKSLW